MAPLLRTIWRVKLPSLCYLFLRLATRNCPFIMADWPATGGGYAADGLCSDGPRCAGVQASRQFVHRITFSFPSSDILLEHCASSASDQHLSSASTVYLPAVGLLEQTHRSDYRYMSSMLQLRLTQAEPLHPCANRPDHAGASPQAQSGSYRRSYQVCSTTLNPPSATAHLQCKQSDKSCRNSDLPSTAMSFL